MTPSMEIVDESGGVSHPHFDRLVTRFAEHVAGLSVRTGCGKDGDGFSNARLTFVYRPMEKHNAGPVFVRRTPIAAHAEGCSIDSPWLIASIDRAKRRLDAVVMWNERQFILDQAVLAGTATGTEELPEPLAQDRFEAHANDYAENVILGAGPKDAAIDELSRRVPKDLVWLFRQSPQSTRGPFLGFVRETREEVIGELADGFGNLVTGLLDRCLSAGTGLHIRHVNQAATFFSDESYRFEGNR